jgi:hypothetical protein
MFHNWKQFFVLSGIIFLATTAFAQDKNKADHDALRALLKTCTEAMNSNKLDALEPSIDTKHFTAITVRNKTLTSFADFKANWNQLFKGDKATLTKAVINPSPDRLTEFLSPTVGVCHGKSEDSYHFKDGDVLPMTIKWTAVVRKVGGTWKISKIHLSANVLDNPALTIAKAFAWKAGGIGAGAGLLVGLILLVLLRKKS